MNWELFGEITNIRYKKRIQTTLKTYKFPFWEYLNINELPSQFILKISKDNVVFAINKWTSPKRTRSYPYARVYDCLNQPVTKVVSIIPVVKDEGEFSNTDYLQWDTIALLSLLNVYVIIAYYSEADYAFRFSKSKGRKVKILKDQKYNNTFILEKLKELSSYQASALHWNLNELKNLGEIINKAREAYENISRQYNIHLSSIAGLSEVSNIIQQDLNNFKDFSRLKSQKAQRREVSFIQPKEVVSSIKKAKITIKNYLGGLYFFTIDEFEIKEGSCFLIEAKHSEKGLPAINNIKDALLKLILYTNLDYLKINNSFICSKIIPVLKLTTRRISKSLKNEEILKDKEVLKMLNKNNLKFFEQLLEEAKINKFELWLEGINDK